MDNKPDGSMPITTRIPRDLHARIRAGAAAQGRTVSNAIRYALSQAYPPPKPTLDGGPRDAA